MAFFDWKDEYCVGVEDIDYQHQRLVDMVNRLHDNLSVDASMRVFIEVFLDQLIQYTDYHFTVEEGLMHQEKYPEYESHKAQHDKLRAQVMDFREKFMKSEANVSEELMQFLKDWLVNHICGTDSKTGKYLHDHGIN